MTIGEKIIMLRKRKGMSQEDLAQVIDVSRQSISKWELNETSPDAQNLQKISKLFTVSVDYLLDESKSDYQENKRGADAGLFVKRHWAKIGYYFAGVGGFGTIASYLFTRPMVDGLVYDAPNIARIINMLVVVPFIVCVFGVVLIVFDRINAKKYKE